MRPQFVVFTDPDPDYRNRASLLVRPLNSMVYLGGFPVLMFKLQIALSILRRTNSFHFFCISFFYGSCSSCCCQLLIDLFVKSLDSS